MERRRQEEAREEADAMATYNKQFDLRVRTDTYLHGHFYIVASSARLHHWYIDLTAFTSQFTCELCKIYQNFCMELILLRTYVRTFLANITGHSAHHAWQWLCNVRRTYNITSTALQSTTYVSNCCYHVPHLSHLILCCHSE